MAAGIGADEALAPVGRRAVGIVLLQRGAVVLALVAEQLAEGAQPFARLDQQLPVVMTGLMAQMAEQRAVGLAEVAAALLTARVVGLGGVKRDDAIGMAGDDGRPTGQRQQQVEGQAQPIGHLGLGLHRQLQAQQRRHEAALGLLDAEPPDIGVRLREVGHGAREAAAAAQREAGLHLGAVQQPVAGGRGVEVGATCIARRTAYRHAGFAPSDLATTQGHAFQRDQPAAGGVITQRSLAGQALAVVEEDGAPAGAAEGARRRRRLHMMDGKDDRHHQAN